MAAQERAVRTRAATRYAPGAYGWASPILALARGLMPCTGSAPDRGARVSPAVLAAST